MGELYTAQECRTLWFSEAGTRLVCETLSERFGRPVEPAEAEALAGHTDDKELLVFIHRLREQASVLPVEPDEIARMMEMARVDGLLLRKTLGDPSDHGSWMMGDTSLPEEIDWPVGKETGVPLNFIAQVDLSKVPSVGMLPRNGVLFFFADLTTEQTDPFIDARVIYVNASVDFQNTRSHSETTQHADAIPITFSAVIGSNGHLFDSKDFSRASLEIESMLHVEAMRLNTLAPVPASFFSRLFPERPIEVQQYPHNLLLGPDYGRWSDWDESMRVPLLTIHTSDRDLGLRGILVDDVPLNFLIEPNDLKRRDFDKVAAVLRDQ